MEILVINLFCMPCLLRLLVHACITMMKIAYIIFFPQINNQIKELKWTLGICKTCQFIFLQENINFQFVPLLLHNTSCSLTIFCGAPLKRMTDEEIDARKFFLVLNLTIMGIRPFTFKCIISPLNIFFKHTIIGLHLKLDRTLTDC